VNQTHRRGVQDDDVGRTAHQLPDPAFEVERQALERGRRGGRVEDSHVDVAPSARRPPRHAPEQVGGDDPVGLSREELTERLLDGSSRHTEIIRRWARVAHLGGSGRAGRAGGDPTRGDVTLRGPSTTEPGFGQQAFSRGSEGQVLRLTISF
jgi:hypothetical protein